MGFKALLRRMIESWIIWVSTVVILIVGVLTPLILHDSWVARHALSDYQKWIEASFDPQGDYSKQERVIEDWIESKYCPTIEVGDSYREINELRSDYFNVSVRKDKDFCYVSLNLKGTWGFSQCSDLSFIRVPIIILLIGCCMVIPFFFALKLLGYSNEKNRN